MMLIMVPEEMFKSTKLIYSDGNMDVYAKFHGNASSLLRHFGLHLSGGLTSQHCHPEIG